MGLSCYHTLSCRKTESEIQFHLCVRVCAYTLAIKCHVLAFFCLCCSFMVMNRNFMGYSALKKSWFSKMLSLYRVIPVTAQTVVMNAPFRSACFIAQYDI